MLMHGDDALGERVLRRGYRHLAPVDGEWRPTSGAMAPTTALNQGRFAAPLAPSKA